MLQSSIGTLTISDLNGPAAAYFWRGEKLAHVLSCLAVNSPKQKRVTLRVTDPNSVASAIDQTEALRLSSVYSAMESVGIVIIKTKGKEA